MLGRRSDSSTFPTTVKRLDEEVVRRGEPIPSTGGMNYEVWADDGRK